MANEINPHKIDMASMAGIEWKFWQAALKGVKLPINPNFAPWGFYKLVKRDKSAIPVAIWQEPDGRKFYRIGDAPETLIRDASDESNFAHSTFQYLADKPMRKAEYKAWMETKSWPVPDGAEGVVAASKSAPVVPVVPVAPAHEPTLAEKVSPIVNAAAGEPGIGHNSGTTAPVEPQDVAGKIAFVMRAAAMVTKIETQAEADASITLSTRLTELVKEANDQREIEKRPHLDKCQAIDALWNAPIIKPAREEAARHGRLRGAFASIETKRRKEAAEAAAAAAAMTATAGDAPAGPAAAPAPVTFTASGGGRTRKAREIKCAKIVDQAELYESIKHYDSVKLFLKELADKVYYSGGELPGCEPDVKVVG